jgi:hypothetical protein
VASGWTAARYSGSSVAIPQNGSAVVASIDPTTAGNYIVNATAVGLKAAGGFLVCRALTESFFGGTYDSTPYGFNNTASTYGTMAETGHAFGSFFSPIQERCYTNQTGASVIGAGLSAILVNKLNGTAAKHAKHHRTPAHKFVFPKAIPGGGQSVLGAHSKADSKGAR